MKWRNSKERELLANGGSREQTLPNKNNPHPDLSDAESDKPKLDLSDVNLSPLNSPGSGGGGGGGSGFPTNSTSGKATGNNSNRKDNNGGGGNGTGSPPKTSSSSNMDMMTMSLEEMGQQSGDSCSSSPGGPLSPYSVQQQQQQQFLNLNHHHHLNHNHPHHNLSHHHHHHHQHHNLGHFRSRSNSPVEEEPTDLSSGNERDDEEISVI